jgi:16S rRNA (guanine527-N7)-methyltransferase
VELLEAGAKALGIHLSLVQMQRFRRYYEELTDWNTRVNLTSVTGWREVQARHFVDSLTVSLAIPPDLLESGRFVDVGSGAGFPGVPLKIAFPGLRPTLVEATARKAAFLSALKDVLGLVDVDVRTGRGETLAHDPELRGGFDFALVRAVGSMAVLAEVTLPFCRVGGFVVAQKKRAIEGEIARARRAVETMGGRVREVRDVTEVAGTEYLGEDRSLVILEKVGPTPDRYPRRPGMPAKRPI